MDLQTMKDRVFATLQDTNRLFVTDSEVEAWLNDAQMELVSRLGEVNLSETTGTTSNTTIAIPSGLIEIKSLEVSDLPVSPLPHKEFEAWVDSGGSTPGSAYVYGVYRVFNDSIEIYPDPGGAVDYTLRYTAEPASLVDDDDVPVVPAHLHMRLVHYARAQARYKEGEMGLGDRELGMFEDGLPSSAAGMARHRPGPISLLPDVSTWVDRDIESAHL